MPPHGAMQGTSTFSGMGERPRARLGKYVSSTPSGGGAQLLLIVMGHAGAPGKGASQCLASARVIGGDRMKASAGASRAQVHVML